jgi:hypothetical protein
MSLSISDVVNVQLIDSPMGASRRDLSMAAIFTYETGDAFNDGSTRYVFVSSASEVANLFGIDSEVYKAAQMYFSITPTPTKAMIARWARTEQKIQATKNAVRGSTLSVDVNIFREVVNGSFSLSVGGTRRTYSGIDLSAAVDLSDVATILSNEVNEDGLEVIYDTEGVRFIVQAKIAGESAETKLGYSEQTDEGEYIGNMLKLEDGQATLVNGSAAVTIAKESPAAALNELHNVYQNWYGIYFAVALTDAELDSAHSWVISSSVDRVLAYTAIRESQIEWNDGNILKKLYSKNSGRLMVQYNNTGDDHAAAALLAQAISTNWAGTNTAKTLKFKQQAVTSDDRITQNEANKCKRLGINFYTDYDGVPMLAEGTMIGGRWIDEIVGLDAFKNACQVQAFNTLQGNPTKIAQTDKGQAQLIGDLNIVGNEFVRNGFLAEGMIWRGNDVGDLHYGDRLEEGYYFYSDSYDTQNSSDRQDREAMPIMSAVKLAGAIHAADIIIQFNR